MIDKISIKAFRLFEDVELTDLPHVNLITGANNTGKTALLEAIYFAFASTQMCERFPGVFRLSGEDPSDDFASFWCWLPKESVEGNRALDTEISADGRSYVVSLDRDREVDLSFDFKIDGVLRAQYMPVQPHARPGSLMGNVGSELAIAIPHVTVFSTQPMKPIELAEHFDRGQFKRGGTERLVKVLKVVEPRLADLRLAFPSGQPLVHADVGLNDLIPVTQLGDGFVRLLAIFSEVIAGNPSASLPGLVLIDEIENGIYHSVLPQVWKGIAELARAENVQVFATTHSYECIRAAHEAFSSLDPYDLAVHRLEWTYGRIRALSYNQVTLGTSMEMNLEVR